MNQWLCFGKRLINMSFVSEIVFQDDTPDEPHYTIWLEDECIDVFPDEAAFATIQECFRRDGEPQRKRRHAFAK